MFKPEYNSVVVGVTEFRSKIPEILKQLQKKHKVILMKRGYPIAVLQSYKEFKEKEDFLKML